MVVSRVLVFSFAVAALAACDDTPPPCTDCGCGNGVIDDGEVCDGADLGGATCQATVGAGGTLACTSSCTLDTTGCTLGGCGDGVIDDGEVCDGADIGGRTCESIGYSAGDIACTADCTFDVAGCCTDTCPADGSTMCVGDFLRTCAVDAAGCLAYQITDCAANGDICDDSLATAACACIDRCAAADDQRCEGAAIETCTLGGDGCLDWEPTLDCATSGEICAVAPSGPTCAADASAEDCTAPSPLVDGENVIAWTALNADYMTSQPSCNTTTLDGPDIVLSYTAPEDGFVSFQMAKPASARQVIVVSSGTCGTIEPELACVVDFTPTVIGGELTVTSGTTYYFYVRDTTSGTAPLDNPLIVTVDEILCSSLVPAATTLSPANAASVPDLTPLLSAQFDYPIDPSAGVITISGNISTDLSFDLATGPPQVSLIDAGKTLVIDPGIVFPVGETVTVSWSGLVDATCGLAIAPPPWTFAVTGPPCTPGQDGMVGSSVTRIATGLSTLSEQYVAVDDDPAGYVYVGGLSDLHRMPKAGGATQDVELAAGLTTSHLGYDMLVVGDEIFTLESNITATSNVLWRISTTGGATWSVENFMQLPQTPNDDLRAVTYHDGRIYMTTDEVVATEIWSIDATPATLPVIAVLEATIPDEQYCTGIALDDFYYYLTCYDDRLMRVDRTTLVPELMTDVIDINITKNAVHAHDFDSDGRADALYVGSYLEEVSYVCDPSASGPFWVDILASFGTSTSNYGLGFDPVGNALWMFDDDTREFVRIE
jgi:hypothetical protein